MSTLVEGTANLSSQVRFNQYMDDLARENSRRTTAWNRWNKGYEEINPKTGKKITVEPQTGKEPPIPFLFDNTGVARKIAGGDSRNYDQILGRAARSAQSTALGKFTDPLAKLKPIDEAERAAQIVKQQDAKLEALEKARIKAKETGKPLTKSKLDKIAKKAEEDALDDLLNPLAGKVAFKEYAEALTKTKELSNSFLAQVYQNTVLYPKATAQMAKTILAPFTHARNFIVLHHLLEQMVYYLLVIQTM